MTPIPTLTKPAATQWVVQVDFSTFPLNAGATLTTSNPRGNLGVVIKDSAGVDVTSTLSEGTAAVAGGTAVSFWLKGGALGTGYTIDVTAPTSDGELLTQRVALVIVA